jgi:para-nitrobenzyl esterase
MGPWSLAEDGWFMPDSLFNMFRTGRRNQVPYLAVSNMGELTGPGLVIADTMIGDYIIMLNGPSNTNSRGYAAIFDKVPDNWRHEGCVAAHGMELHYMFGSLDVSEAWEAHYNGFALSGAKSLVPTISNVDRNISEAMMKIWTQFARTGNPSVKGIVEWPAWEPVSDQYLYIGEQLKVKSGYSDLLKIKPVRSSMSL